MDTNGEQHAVVLVADNQQSVLKAVSSTLEKAGFTVLTAADKATALQLFASGARVRLAILDGAMPGNDLEELVVCLNECRPGTPILLTSGGDDVAACANLGRPGQVRGFIRKPFRRSQLLGSVLNVLDEPLALTA